MRIHSRGRSLLFALVAATAALMALPFVHAPLASNAPAPTPASHALPSSIDPVRPAVTVSSHSPVTTSHGVPVTIAHYRGAPGPRFGGAHSSPASGPTSLAVKKKPPAYDWSSAYIFYGPPPPSADLLLGEGAGLVTDNALNRTVMFGGLGRGGLSNVTWIYGYAYNASAPENSVEYGGFTNSTSFPSSRTNASFGVDQADGVAVLFGGLTSLQDQTTGNDTWLYYFANDTWVNITRPNGPPPREEAAFSVDQKDGVGLLFGGIAPAYTSRGSTGTVIWKDTWEFSFATSRWTEITSSTTPTDRFGASMVWDSVSNEFLLVGGCSFSCSMDAWGFAPGTGTWSSISESGDTPPARAGASFAWDPGGGQAILYGGYSFDPNGSQLVYSDAYEFLSSGQWIRFLPSAPGPPPLYQPGPIFDASTTWSNFPGCNAMWIMGGNPSLQGPPQFVYVIQPTNDTPAWQCWSFLNQVQGPPGAPPPCSRQSQLVVTVESSVGSAPIPNAIVEISGQCLPATQRTGLDGSTQFTTNTPDNISINVSAANFHGHQLNYNYTYTNTSANTSHELIRYVLVTLVPYPSLNVQVFGNTGATFYVPVPGASVTIDNFTVVAVTGRSGWGNDSAVAQFNQTAIVSASATNYSTSWKSVFIPYAGELNVTLVLLRAGALTVSVRDSRSGVPIPGATGVVTRIDPGLPAPFHYVTNSLGQYTTQLRMGNYSANAAAIGYLTNVSGGYAFLPWITGATITIRLEPAYGTNESVRLVDSISGAAIAGGTVTFGEYRPIRTNAAGWANGTDLLPPGRALVLGLATGYLPNSTIVVLGYNTVLPPVTLRLHPSCLTGCPLGGNGAGAGGSPFLPVGGSALLLLLTAPAILVIIGTLYALAIGARTGGRGRRARGRPSSDAT
ncbi:MAG: hypothetical protein L3J95_05250 [Thermoplasmata archaeon]|nr:hypothetical protein [Thermoplasmata archaeon]MCI4359807.1 hypothetical protein [Thermoplasmata archaeon]